MGTKTTQERPRWFWVVLLTLCLTVFITLLDTMLLTVSLPTLVREFHTPIQSVQWALSAYSLALISLMITGGRLGDLYGRKRTFMAGAIVFALGSLLSSLSSSAGMLIGGEAVEGLGAALMVPATTALIVSNFSGRARAFAFGLYTSFASLGLAAGPLLGGFFTTYYSWRWGFRINLFVVFLLLCGSIVLKNARDTEERRYFDVVGVLLSAAGLFAIVFGLIESSTHGWWSATLPFVLFGYSLHTLSITPVAIAAGVLLLGMFLWCEARVRRRGDTPLISPHIFNNRQFSTGLLITFLTYPSVAGTTFSLSIFFQSVQGDSAFQTGLQLLPYATIMFVASQVSAYLARYIRPRHLIQAGFILGIVGLSILRHAVGAGAPLSDLLAAFLCSGTGVAFIFAQFSNMTLSAVSVEEAGEASGIFNTVRYSGALFSNALIGSLLVAAITAHLVVNLRPAIISTGSEAGFASIISTESSALAFGDTSVSFGGNQAQVRALARLSVMQAVRDTLNYNIAFALIAFLFTFTLTKSRDLELNRSAAK